MRLTAIGTIRTPYMQLADCPRNTEEDGPECRLIVDLCYLEALNGLQAGDRIEILYWLDQAEFNALRRRSRRSGEVKGIFALRTPHRPNPIGSACLKLLAIEGNQLMVQGLDCLDGTDLIDIKPCRWS